MFYITFFRDKYYISILEAIGRDSLKIG